MRALPDLAFSVSATTRPKRPSEKEGEAYYFMSVAEFLKRAKQQDFVEYEQVYDQVYYGTLRSELERIWQQGQHVLMDVDVKGGINLKRLYPDCSLAVFVDPPSLAVLEDRLRARATDSEESIQRRMAKAAFEISHKQYFDVTITNDRLEDALAEATRTVAQYINSPAG